MSKEAFEEEAAKKAKKEKKEKKDKKSKDKGDEPKLQRLEIIKARKGLFNDWLKSKNKLGGQHKIPRLSNSRRNLDDMLLLNSQPAPAQP